MLKNRYFRSFLVVVTLLLLCGTTAFLTGHAIRHCGYPAMPDIPLKYHLVTISVANAQNLSLLKNVTTEMRMLDVTFSPNGNRLAISGQKGDYWTFLTGRVYEPCGVLFVWRVQPDQLSVDLSFAEATATALIRPQFGPSGRLLYAESPTGIAAALLWDVETNREVLHLGEGVSGSRQDAAFSQNGTALAYSNEALAYTRDGSVIQVWETSNLSSPIVQEFPDKYRGKPIFVGDETIAVVFPPHLLLWNYREPGEPTVLVENVDLGPIAFDAGTNYLAVSIGPDIHVWYMKTKEVIVELPWYGASEISFHPNHGFLIASSYNRITIWNAANWIRLIDIEDFGFTTFALSTSGELFGIGYENGVVEIWDVETGSVLRTLQNGTGAIHALDFNADDTLLTVISNDGYSIDFWGIVSLWSTPDKMAHPHFVWS